MPKRHDALMPLSYDHYHGLVRARALIAASDADPDTRRGAAESFVRFYGEDTHLQITQRGKSCSQVAGACRRGVGGADPRVGRACPYPRHGGSTEGPLTSGAAGGEQLRKLGETLRAHVRLEENHVFPLIERAVPEDDLRAVVFAEEDPGLTAAEPSEAKIPDQGSMALVPRTPRRNVEGRRRDKIGGS